MSQNPDKSQLSLIISAEQKIQDVYMFENPPLCFGNYFDFFDVILVPLRNRPNHAQHARIAHFKARLLA